MDIASLVAQIAASMGIDPVIAVAQAQAESDFDPNAVSSEGAIGVMQLMPDTAAGLGVSDPTDPTQNITAGLTFDSQLLAQFGGDWSKALAAYNWGPANVQKAIAAYGPDWFSHAPSVTQNYVNKILSAEGSVDLSSEMTDGAVAPPAPSEIPSWAAPAAIAVGVGVLIFGGVL
jgi:soluble lytic murein transglycosylase-like protein